MPSIEACEGSPRLSLLYHLAKGWDSTRPAMDSDGVRPDDPSRVMPAGLAFEKIFTGEGIRPALQRLYSPEGFAESLSNATLTVVAEPNAARDYLASGGCVLTLSVGDFPHVQTGF